MLGLINRAWNNDLKKVGWKERYHMIGPSGCQLLFPKNILCNFYKMLH